jgi:DNA-directed RNA polymerase subunit RPC12/RpoP
MKCPSCKEDIKVDIFNSRFNCPLCSRKLIVSSGHTKYLAMLAALFLPMGNIKSIPVLIGVIFVIYVVIFMMFVHIDYDDD